MKEFDIDNLEKEQIKLSKEIITRDDYKKITKVAGFGRAFLSNKILAVVTVFDYRTKKIIESKFSVSELEFPYIPGLLSYRESKALIDAYNKLENEPDIVIVPAHGLLHPRKFGMASHIGLLIDKPAIGISKHLICGKVEEGKIYIEKSIVGSVIKTKEHSNPIYLSIGHKISLGSAIDIIKRLTLYPHKMPEPLHEANKIAKKLRKKNDRSV
jgi:deoxyribonuclease V